VSRAIGVQFPGIMRPGGQWQIGGVRLHLSSVDSGLRVTGPPGRAAFASSGHSDATITTTWGNLAAVSSGDAAFDSGGLWTASQNGGAFRFEFRSPRFGAVPYKLARIREDFTAGEVILHHPYFDANLPVDPLEYPLEELIVIGYLAREDGVVLHGCGVADGDEGLLFLGPSGAGKSTMARLWTEEPGVSVLSDDRIVVRVTGERLMMHGTPWHGDEPVALPGPVELRRVFFLRHGRECVARRIEGVAAVAELVACSFPPFYDAEGLAAAVCTLERIAQRTSCAELWFPNDRAAIERVRALAR
jgi:hypothetical protein